VSEFESKNLAAIRKAIDAHNAECPVPANAILLNPVDHELMGWDELWGLPVLADERVPTKRVRIDCDGSAYGIEDEVAEVVSQQAPAQLPMVLPAGPREDEPNF
jgi:hypothetical protein